MPVTMLVMGTANLDTPVSKAIDLLTDLQAKITSEGENATRVHAKATAMCKDRSTDLGFAIQTLTSEVEDHEATIKKEGANMATLSDEIDTHDSNIATNDADLKAATEIREKEAADFAAMEKETVEIIDTLQRAISILEREMQKSGSFIQGVGAKSIVQALDSLVHGSLLSTADASRLTTLIQSGRGENEEDDVSLGAPDVAVYEGQSHDIIKTLEDLLDKAQEQLSDARKAETTSSHNFKLLEQSLTDETKFETNGMEEAKKKLAQSTVSKAAAAGDLAMASKSLAESQASLQKLTEACEQDQKNFETEMASRADELAAIAEALKALGDMTSNAAEISYGLSQQSFLQRSRISSSSDLAGIEVVRQIRDLANKVHTPELALLESRVSAAVQQGVTTGEDPFAKVKGLISDLITKLEQEASADASRKAYCDEELSETTEKKEDKDSEMAKLTSSIDVKSTTSAKLKEEIAALQSSLSALASYQAEMDALRKDEHSAYLQSKSDMEMGLQGVSLALQLLREYYAKNDKAHAAAEGSGTSIIGMLEVVQSDFSKDLASIEFTEQEAQSNYESQTHENAVEKATLQQDVKYKTKESAALDKAVAEASSDRSAVQAELDAVNEYLATLQEQCTDKAMTYEERKKRREAEIAGLKEALSVLESEAALVQQRSRSSKRFFKLRARGF